MGIITADFMLRGETARRLYHGCAESLPIIDYHCHLPVRYIAEDHRFADAAELFLGGDHYKWRQERVCGVPERLITGDAPPEEKWAAFAGVLPKMPGNPLYHWTALELSRYFGVDEPLCPANAGEIYRHCTAHLAGPGYTARGLIERSGVEVICTTDDPDDNLSYHRKIAREGFGAKVYPAFRPDKYLRIGRAEFPGLLRRAGVTDFGGLVEHLRGRAYYFAEAGCRISDHALESVPFAPDGDPDEVLRKRLAGERLTKKEEDVFATALLTRLAEIYKKLGWAMQLHIGALRDNNPAMFRALGPDTGFDSVGDAGLAKPLAGLLGHLSEAGTLPKTIVYPLNPADYYPVATLAGCFSEEGVGGLVQLGAAWWFLDHKEGMLRHLRTLGALGSVGTFIGMLTDSRSFVSYPRHEYFRRIFCDWLGGLVDSGEYPRDPGALRALVAAVCHDNAKEWFGF